MPQSPPQRPIFPQVVWSDLMPPRGAQTLLDVAEGNRKGWACMTVTETGREPNNETYVWLVRATRLDGVIYGGTVTMTSYELHSLAQMDRLNLLREKIRMTITALERIRRCNCRMDRTRGLIHCGTHGSDLT